MTLLGSTDGTALPTSQDLALAREAFRQALLSLVIFSAMSATVFALWAEYFGRGVTDENREESFATLRMQGVLAFLAQLVIYAAHTPAIQGAPVLTLGILMAALLVQSQTQFALEKKIRGIRATPADQLRFTARAVFWSCASLATYIVSIFTLSTASILACRALEASQNATLAAVVLATVAGALVGLWLSFGLSPFFVRKSLPTTALNHERVRELISRCFSRAGLAAPEVWVIEMDEFRNTNAMVAGFRSGRGPFRPALFVTRSLISELTDTELEAVLLHEAAHMRHHHLRKRFLFSIASLAATATGCSLAFVVGYALLPAPLRGLVALVTPVVAFVAPFMAMRRQIARQEIEADVVAVRDLGADFTGFQSALRKLDRLNDRASGRGRALEGGHPLTELRIALVARAIEIAAMSRSGVAAQTGPDAAAGGQAKDQDRAA
jgi:Zn-dependent protease with chaperone function